MADHEAGDPEMTEPDPDDRRDEDLLAALRATQSDDAPPDMVDRAKALHELFDLDQQLATLLHDSADERSLAGVRAAGDEVRSLEYSQGDVRLALMIDEASGSITGTVEGAVATQARLDTLRGPTRSTAVDDGLFTFDLPTRGSFRIRVIDDSTELLRTEFESLR